MIIVDASLALKWYFNEPLSVEAETWFAENQGDISVPETFMVEVIGALVRRANMHKSLRNESESAITRFIGLFDEQLIKVVASTSQHMTHAAKLALNLGHPLKDCLYLALAMELGCDLVTCDARFAAKAKDVWDRVRVLGA